MINSLYTYLNKNKLKLSALSIVFFIFFGYSNSASAATLSRPSNNLGLVGYWSLNEGTGTAAMDYSGNGNTGTLLSSPTWSNGKLGSALTFNGTNQVTANDSALPAASSTLTVSAWIKTTSTTPTFQALVKYGGSTSGSQYYIGMYKGTDCTGTITSTGGNFAAVAGTGGSGSNVCDNVTINDGLWHNITSTYDGTNHLLYVDGVLKSSRTQTLAITPGGAGAFHIGGFAGSLLTGSADEVRVYNRVLSATQVTSLYNVGVQKYTGGVSNNGLVGYWSFNEATGTIATDYSGNGNKGTLVSMANPPTSTSGWGNGHLGGALNFDGSTSYVNAGTGTSTANFAATTGGSPSSWSFWIKPNSTTSGTILARNDGNTVSPGWWITFTSGKIQLILERTVANTSYNFNFPNTGVWTHVVLTQSGNAVTPTVTAYINGVLTSPVSTSAGTGVSASDTAQTLYIGRYGATSGGGNGFYSGALDEVRIYNRVLSATEAARLYNGGLQKINASRNITGGSLDQGLAGLWSFDGKDMYGTTTVYDRSGNGNNGTTFNNPIPTIGKIGQAMQFNESNTYVNVPDSTSLQLTSQFSLVAWVYFTGNTGNIDTMFMKNNSNSNYYGMYIYGNRAWFYNPSITIATAVGSVPSNKWIHVVLTFDSTLASNNAKIYLNGAFDNAVTKTSAFGSNAGYPLTIGKDNVNGRYFGGKLDDVRIYNRALTASEVQLLYNLGK